MAEVKKINHKGKTIFYADHRGLQGDKILENQNTLLEMIKSENIINALSITDMRDVVVSQSVNEGMKKIGNNILQYSKKAAVVGMASGLKQIIISGFLKIASKPMALFNTIEEAKEWLVKD